MGISAVFANAPPLAKAEASEWGVLPLIALIVALIVAILLTYRVVRDLKGEGPLTNADDLVNPLLQAYAAGEINREEFLRHEKLSSGRGTPTRTSSNRFLSLQPRPNRHASRSKPTRHPTPKRLPRDRFRPSGVGVRQRAGLMPMVDSRTNATNSATSGTEPRSSLIRSSARPSVRPSL